MVHSIAQGFGDKDYVRTKLFINFAKRAWTRLSLPLKIQNVYVTKRYSSLTLAKIKKIVKSYFTEQVITLSKKVYFLLVILYRIYIQNATVFN